MNKKIFKPIAFIATLALILTSTGVNYAFAGTSPPAAEVTYHYGTTTLNSADFESSVNQIISDSISAAGISTKTILYTNLVSTEANAGDINSWTVYSHGDVQWPTYYAGGAPFTAPTDKNHIQISTNGKVITFYGYTSSAFNDFLIFKSAIPGQKSFNFTLDSSQLQYHSMLGGGFLFNAVENSGNISGYLVLFAQSTINLYELNNVNINNLHEAVGGGLTSQTGVSLLPGGSISYTPTSTMNVEVVVTGDNKFNLKNNNATVFSDFALPTVFGDQFGPFASFASHNCGQVSIFGFQDLEMSITSTKTFAETLHEYNWSESARKFLVNVDNDSSEYASGTTASAMIADLDREGVYYIGVGTATNEAISVQFNRDGMGTYIVIPSDSTYGQIADFISDAIISDHKIIDLTATAGNQQVTLNFAPPTGAEDGDVVVEQSEDGISFTPAAIEAPVTSESSIAVVTGLTNGLEYWFRLDIGSGQYEGFSNIATATPRVKHHTTTVEPVIQTPPNMLLFSVGDTDSFLKLGTGNEIRKPMDVAPIITGDRTLLPIRFVVEPIGGAIVWNQAEKKVTITRGDTTIELWIGNNTAKVNGVSKIIDPDNLNVKPIIINPGRTMLPLRFISETLGCNVEWNQETQQITITNW